MSGKLKGLRDHQHRTPERRVTGHWCHKRGKWEMSGGDLPVQGEDDRLREREERSPHKDD